MGVEAARLALRRAATLAPARCGSPPPPRPTSTRPTPPPSTPRCASTPTRRLRLRRRRCARRSARCCSRSTGAADPALVVAADLRTGLPGSADESAGGDARGRAPRRRRRHRSRDRRAPRARRAPPRSSSSAGARRASRAPSCGRSASARSGTSRSASRRGTRRSTRPGSPPTTSTAAAVVAPHARAWRARSAASSTACHVVDDLAADGRQHRRRAPGVCCSPSLLETGRARPGDRARRARRRRRRAAVPHHRRARVVPAGALGRRRRSPAARRSPYGKFLSLARRCSRSSRRAGPSPPASRRRRRAAPRTGSSGSSARATATSGALHLPPARVSRVGDARRRHGRPRRWPTSQGTIVTLHHRPPRVLAEPADRVRGRRLRRRRPAPGRAHRRRRRRASQIGDRVEMTFRKLFTADEHPQLLLEGPPGSGLSEGDTHGFARHQGPGRHRRDGLHALRRALGQGHRRPRSSTRPKRRLRVGRHRPRTTSTPTGSAPRRSGMSGITLARPLQLARQAGHPRRELLRDRLRGAAPGRVRGGVAARTTSRWRSASRR